MTKSNSSIAADKDSSFSFDNYILGLIKSKNWIIGLTIFVTLIIVVFGLLKTPIYQASAKIILASYDMPQIICKNELRTENACKKEYQKDELLRHSSETVKILNLFAASKINNTIEIKDNQNDTLTIISNATSIDQAKLNIEKIFDFLKKENISAINNIKDSRKKLISTIENNIYSINALEIKPIQDKNEIDGSILERKINEAEENIFTLETKSLPEINEGINALNKMIEEKLLSLNKQIEEKLDIAKENQLSRSEQLTLYQNYNHDNNILLKFYEKNLEKIDSNNIDQIIAQSTQIKNLRREIFETSQAIIQLNSENESLLYQLDFHEEERKLLSFSRDFGNTYIPQKDSSLSPFLSAVAFAELHVPYGESKLILINLVNLIAQKNNLINKINDKKLILLDLKDQQNLYLNYTVPNSKFREKQAFLEIENLSYQLSEYKDLILPSAYSNIELSGEIIAPQKQFSPNILLYGIYGFIASLSLFIFLFSIINLFRSTNKA